MKITSVNNELVKETAKLLQVKYREESGLFLIEGEKGVKEALEAGIEIKKIFTLENFPINADTEIIETTEAVLSKISDAKSAPKIIAVAVQPKSSVEDFKRFKKVLLLENIKDAGNLGTILRTSTAFNIDGIVLYGNTVDLFNPKCVRSAVGNLWKLPIIKIKDFTLLQDLFINFDRIATLPKGKEIIPLNDFEFDSKTLIMFGSEADGLSFDLKNFATRNLTIEMNPNVESLNLSISVGVVLYKMMNN